MMTKDRVGARGHRALGPLEYTPPDRTRYLVSVDQALGVMQYRIELRAIGGSSHHAWACFRSGSSVPFKTADHTFQSPEDALRDAERAMAIELKRAGKNAATSRKASPYRRRRAGIEIASETT